MPLEWEEGLSVGVESIDVEHRQILRRLRRLMETAAEGHLEELRSSFRFLQRYMAAHFENEERWMAEHGYPGALEHTRGHAALVDAIGLARRTVEEQGGEGAAPAARIASAIEHHLRTDDLRLGQFWTARENLRRLAEEGPGVGVSLTPIPGMVRSVRTAPAHEPPREPDPVPFARPPVRRS